MCFIMPSLVRLRHGGPETGVFTKKDVAKSGHGSAVSLRQIVGTQQCLGLYILGDVAKLGHGSAVSLPENNVKICL
ncbi:MAG: hypothetical protein EAZ09_04165 [Oscillatoriales cyanobacterium]|nr:MAG: hypothetical protein EAZ09_04165 [Oscillatoriales cyanobacterium]